MTDNISRRDFLKLAGAGAAATAVLTGCGPASRYVTREPYTKMPEYAYNGLSTFFATTCRECPAGCGLVVRTMQGRALKVEGNKNNPINLGKTCARGQATLHGLYNPDRMENPVKQASRGSRDFTTVTWDAAVNVVADALKNTRPGEIAFLMGLAPDHLFDLVSMLTRSLGGPDPLRFSALGIFDARDTLSRAAEDLFGQQNLLFFDIGNADVTFSFGANFMETWLSPVAYIRGYADMRRGEPGRRGYLVQFEPRMSQTASNADEWIPIIPGTEGPVALALGRLVAEARGGALPAIYANVDVTAIAGLSGVPEDDLRRLAKVFSDANHPLAIPGGGAMGQANGLQAAEAILTLDVLVNNLGQAGGLTLAPSAPKEDAYHRPASLKEISGFIADMNAGKVKALFVHGVNPVFELPKSLGFEAALKNVPLIVSFATFPDETAMQADYVFPDHHGLESWGYQRSRTGTSRSTLSGAQPAVVPYYSTRAAADVLLSAAQVVGGDLAKALPFKDEVEFLQDQLQDLVAETDGFFTAPDINKFFADFQQYGGWWKNSSSAQAPAAAGVLDRQMDIPDAQFNGGGDFYFFPFMMPVLAEAGANKPWLQEIPDPTTTVTWNTWVEINPATAEKLGVDNDDVVLVTSPAGTLEASVYKYPAIRPDTIAVPFGQGHTAYGRYAEGRGANPADLLSAAFNDAGDLAFGSMKVTVQKTGKRKQLARLESILGVYGGFSNP
jgi:anaerobic selenocysteine-containing dehydrogenase